MRRYAFVEQSDVRTGADDTDWQVRWLHFRTLSHDPKKRFEELFRLRARWRAAEMVAFVEDIIPPGLNTEQFLLKHARNIAVPIAGQTGKTETIYIPR